MKNCNITIGSSQALYQNLCISAWKLLRAYFQALTEWICLIGARSRLPDTQGENRTIGQLQNDLPALAFLGLFPKISVAGHSQEKNYTG